MATTAERLGDGGLDADLSGLDNLERVADQGRSRGARLWSKTWPKLAALAIAFGGWQLVVESGWRKEYVLPAPATVLATLWDSIIDGSVLEALAITMRRAAIGYGAALLIGLVVGVGVARSSILRNAVGSLITGLQTMPSIAWFPMAVLLFRRTEGAIFFVIILGAAPSIAGGIISGIDHIPPLLLRAGRVLGARGFAAYRHVVLPAALPGFVGGLKQGWAFAWRSLMAGELLVIIANQTSLGVRLQVAREFADAEGLLATILVILIVGIVLDALVFGRLDRAVRRRWGLLES